MRKTWPRGLIFGVLLLAVVACRPVSEDEVSAITSTPPLSLTAAPNVAQRVTATAVSPFTPTNTPPANPTAIPTTPSTASWQQIGDDLAGFQINVPPDWRDLSGTIDTAQATSPLGFIVLLVADSDRTGSAILAQKELSGGAYAAGMLVTNTEVDGAPTAALEALVDTLPDSVTPLSTAVSTSARVSAAGSIAGAYQDVSGAPLALANSGQNNIRTRLLLLRTAAGEPDILFLFASPESTWTQFAETFTQMAETIFVHNVSANFAANDGSRTILGSLGETDLVNGRLAAAANDIWTFSAESGRYATLTLSPDDKDIDLIFSLITPSGQTITEVDNGFAGDTEVVIDLLLNESGTYLVEVSEFFNAPGRYTLSLALTDNPLFSGGGRIDFGQTVQSELPANGQKVWRFDGIAGQTISVVMAPEGQFDAILDLYAPDGTRLVGLDEGFSGDPEVLAGYTLPVTGVYTLLVRSFAGDGGGYTLSLDSGGEDTENFFDAGDLGYGDTRQETLRENEAHAWFFNGKAGDAIDITVTPIDATLDLDVWLVDPDIERLDAQDENMRGEPETLTQVLPRDGQYLILVNDFYGMGGRYEITLAADPVTAPTMAGTLTYGDPVTGLLAASEQVVWYFEAEEGDLIDIELSTTNATRDLQFMVQTPAGVMVKSMDEAGAGGAEALEMFAITEDGRWGIVVREFFGDTTPYALRVQESSEP